MTTHRVHLAFYIVLMALTVGTVFAAVVAAPTAAVFVAVDCEDHCEDACESCCDCIHCVPTIHMIPSGEAMLILENAAISWCQVASSTQPDGIPGNGIDRPPQLCL